MFSSARFFLIAYFIAVTSGLPSNQSNDCPRRLINADKCMANAMLIGAGRVIIPKTVNELDSLHCNRLKGQAKCLMSYKTCLKGFPRLLFNIISKNAYNRLFKHLCGSPKGRQEFVDMMQCFNSSSITIAHEIVHKLTAALNYINEEVTTDKLIPTMCCSYNYVLDTGKRLLDEMCSQKTGSKTTDSILANVRAVMGEAVDLSCGQHSSVQVCDRKEPQIMAKMREFDGADAKPMPYTPLVPLLAIAERLQ